MKYDLTFLTSAPDCMELTERMRREKSDLSFSKMIQEHSIRKQEAELIEIDLKLKRIETELSFLKLRNDELCDGSIQRDTSTQMNKLENNRLFLLNRKSRIGGHAIFERMMKLEQVLLRLQFVDSILKKLVIRQKELTQAA